MKHIETAIFGGGCFWCTEAVFQHTKGVVNVTPGYAGGTRAEPTYSQVSEGSTGHAEVVKVVFDPSVISYRDLLKVFFTIHDPTTPNQQGYDKGSQYRSIIIYTSTNQKLEAQVYINLLNSQKAYKKPIVTQLVKFDSFYEAEVFHHNYYEANSSQPYCQLVIAPKLKHFEAIFPEKSERIKHIS